MDDQRLPVWRRHDRRLLLDNGWRLAVRRRRRAAAKHAICAAVDAGRRVRAAGRRRTCSVTHSDAVSQLHDINMSGKQGYLGTKSSMLLLCALLVVNPEDGCGASKG